MLRAAEGNAAVANVDDYENLVSALGTANDKAQHTRFSDRQRLDQNELEALYEHEPLASRIVDRVVDDAVREPFSLSGTDVKFDWRGLESELEGLDALNRLADGWRWGRLYGGALVVMVVNDNCDMGEPLQLDRATKLLSLQVVEAPFAQPRLWDPGLGSAAFRAPSKYDITVPFGKKLQRGVHGSRVIRFDGVRVPPNLLTKKNGWGPSVLDRVWSELRRLGSAMGSTENILHELSVMVLSMKGFRTAAAGSDKDKAQLQKVFETMRWAMSNLRTLVLDSEDNYAEAGRSVQGLALLIDRFVDAVVRATDMPRTVLLGQQPGGLNAEASGEQRSWYDHVAVQQKKVLTPALTKLLDVVLAMRRRRGEPVPSKWTIEYAPLWQPTEKEQADTELVRAQARQIYAEQGWAAGDEIRQELVARGTVKPLPTPARGLGAGAEHGT